MNSRAFVFTLDVLVALLLVISFMGIAVVLPYERQAPLSALQKAELVASVIDSMDENILLALDQNVPADQKVNLIYSQISVLMPATIDYRMGLRPYDANTERCRQFKTFQDCFPLLENAFYAGSAVPTDREVIFGKREYVAKKAQGRCVTGTPEEDIEGYLSGLPTPGTYPFAIYLQGEPILTDTNIFLDMNISTARDPVITEGDTVQCDEDVRVNFSAGYPGRAIADIMMVTDRSGSMDECLIGWGNPISTASGTIGDMSQGSIGNGTKTGCPKKCKYDNWQLIKLFTAPGSKAFSVWMQWNASCGGECPKMYIQHVASDTNYGFYGGSPGGVLYETDSSHNYISVNSSRATSGTWNVYAWNDNPAIDYNVTVNFPKWEIADTFDITDLNAFTVLLTWNKDCSNHCPELYIEHISTGTTYGYYGGNPGNCDVSGSSLSTYVAVPSSSSRNGTWRVWVWKEAPGVNYNITVETVDMIQTKLDAVKTVSVEFVNNAEWDSRRDFSGLTSFATDAKTDQPLTANRTAVENQINNLVAGGMTAMGDGIYEATEELHHQPTGHARVGSMKFEVLLSDGYWNYGSDPIAAAYDAADHGIKIYTVGFGFDADEAMLRQIAEITGGAYYFAKDENALSAAYDAIAKDIGADLSQGVPAGINELTFYMPVPSGSEIVDPDGGTFETIGDTNYLKYFIGDMNQESALWNGYYIINFPCNNNNNCQKTSITFPSTDAYFTYSDGVETYKAYAQFLVTVNFWYRNLLVDIVSGYIAGPNTVDINVVVQNIGYLDSNPFTINFYEGDGRGYYPGINIGSQAVPALCPREETGCTIENYTFRFEKILNTIDYVWAVIDENIVRDCPLYNRDYIFCYGGRKTSYYVMDYWAWSG